MMWGVPGVGGHLSTPFTTLELSATIKLLKGGKAQGPDNIPPEFMMHCGKKCLEWVRKFFSFCLEHTVIPKIWRRATVVAILKPNKPADDPKSYRPISLLCVPYKILERLILAHINPVMEPELPTQQAGFRQGRSTVQQILKLTCEIEKSFEKGYKAGAVMVDLTAAYDTVWHQGLALKLLRTIPDRHLVRFIMTILSNRSFKLKTSTGQISRLRILKNGLPQGSTLSPILFNIYISDIPTTVSHQYGYADDMALLYSHKCWSKVEEMLSRDMEDLADLLKTWRLKLNSSKTTLTPFHLNNQEAKRQLNICVHGTTLPHNPHPRYLGVKLDRQLTYRQHIEGLRGKVMARNNFIRCLSGSTWGANAKTLRTAALAIVYSSAEYATPVWSRSSHTKKLDVSLNDTMRIITGCVKPTPTHLLPVLSGIAPTKRRRNYVSNKISYHAWANKEHPLHSLVPDPQNLRPQRLKSRHPFYRHAAEHHNCDQDIIEAWNKEWTKHQCPKQLTITPDTTAPPGSDLPRKLWVILNRLRAGVGWFGTEMHKWGLRTSASCACRAATQNAEHILFDCNLLRPSNTVKNLINVTDDTKNWLQHLAKNLR